MIKNKIFSLGYRLVGFGLALSGIIIKLLEVRLWKDVLTFTFLSCLFACVLLGMLAIRTLISLIKEGAHGDSSFFPRLEGIATILIFFTLVVYWAIVAPGKDSNLFTYLNITLHLVIPILVIVDYIVVRGSNFMKKIDLIIYIIPPLIYWIFIIIIGFLKLVAFESDNYFPYGFMNFHKSALPGAIILPAIVLVYVGVTFLLYFLDTKFKTKPTLIK
ncbi:MAG: hypothetical protein LBV55_02020 [Acholeplasmatales bacterium]|jgi:hypothetical protein|nr:hypothetical protein [Acholeplasmatales bacterium]